jgi:dTDP-4-amino-4,6-dideoxygalactose transaminase
MRDIERQHRYDPGMRRFAGRRYHSIMLFPIIRPAMPPVERWAGLLAESYGANRFSNFGPLATRFEALLAGTWGSGCSACVLVSSCTAAIAAPLIARGVRGPVLLPAFTFPATLAAIRMAGAEPVLVDVCPTSWTTDVATLDAALAASGARAAVVLRPFGLRTDLAPHACIAGRHGAVLVIDNAAGLGVDRSPPETDPWVYEAYSLHATTPFGIGEAGAVFAHRDEEQSLRRAINFGLPNPDGGREPAWGINAKLSEFQAAVGLAVAETFAGQLARRRVLAARYAAMAVSFPEILCRSETADGAWQFFPLLLPSSAAADRFTAATRGRGMEIRRYYAPSLSRFRDVPRLHECPVSEDLAGRMCCVPVYPDASDGEIDEMVSIVADALRISIAGS